MLHIYQSICLLTAAALLPALQEEVPETTGPVIAYWRAMQVSQAGEEDARFSRLVGYIEGTYGIAIADWWTTEGVTHFAPKSSIKKFNVFGSHPQDSLETNHLTFSVVPDNFEISVTVAARLESGVELWRTKVEDVLPELGVGGSISLDCSLVRSKKSLFVFGRAGKIRFILCFSPISGKLKSSFAFSKDGQYLHAAEFTIMEPPPLNLTERAER